MLECKDWGNVAHYGHNCSQSVQHFPFGSLGTNGSARPTRGRFLAVHAKNSISGLADWRHLSIGMTEDQQWLEEYCQDRSDRAFRFLVDKHLPMVHSAAMRMVQGDAHLAEDIAQCVFSNLARKARTLPAGVVLAGWLHRDTRFTALEILRRERRRLAREQVAATMHAIESETVDWTRVGPLLDETLDELEDQDRHAILLRFFQSQTLAEVGTALGLTEDTARKRVGRALDKLRERLGRRGVTTTAAALSLALTTRTIQPAPAGLSTQIAAAALPTSLSHSLLTTVLIMSSMKSTTGIVAILLLLGLSGGAFTLFRHLHPGVAERLLAGRAMDTGTRSPGGDPGHASVRLARSAASGDALTSALARIRDVLEDPKPTRTFPNPAMSDALAALGASAKEALPILEEGMHSRIESVRLRAIDGLGILGPEAKEKAQVLSGALRTSTSVQETMMLVQSLLKMGPMPGLLPDVVRGLKENPEARLAIANSLPELAGPDVRQVPEALQPLLEDANAQVRVGAAYALAMMQRSSVGPGVWRVVTEMLSVPDEDDRGLALSSMKNIGSDPSDPTGQVKSSNLGPDAAKALPALAEIANQTTRKDHRDLALELLNAIRPDLRNANPGMESALQQREQSAEFARRVRSGQADVAEMAAGLTKYPDAIPATANALIEAGEEARAALPAMRAALAALTPDPATSLSDFGQMSRNRDAVVDAIQKIAPDEPKPYFTDKDVGYLFEALDSPELRADRRRQTAVGNALKDVLGQGQRPGIAMSPEEIRRVLQALKSADTAAFQAVAERVQKIDPHFVTSGK